jgi:molecular chaperone GrpE
MNKKNDNAEPYIPEASAYSGKPEHMDCHQQLQACQEELLKAEERYTYLSADFNNYRRRAEQERLRALHMARKNVMLSVLTLVDNFERAQATFNAIDSSTPDALERIRSGIEFMYKAALKILEEQQVRPIEQMTQFDPALHEAMLSIAPEQLPAPLPGGTIVDVLEKGYTLNGELLRPARVTMVAHT